MKAGWAHWKQYAAISPISEVAVFLDASYFHMKDNMGWSGWEKFGNLSTHD
jgi:hypothetical protein